MTIEDKLKKKGYTLQEIYQNIEEAKKTALQWRQAGYKARVVKYSTSVKGWYDYGV